MTPRRAVLRTGALLVIGLLAVAAERAVTGWLGATDPLVPLIVGFMNAAAVLALGAAALLGLATTFGSGPAKAGRSPKPRLIPRRRCVPTEG